MKKALITLIVLAMMVTLNTMAETERGKSAREVKEMAKIEFIE